MYPNLLGQKAYHGFTDDYMAKAIGLTRNAYAKKLQSGRFTVKECKTYCELFNKPFSYLFATDEEICTSKAS